MARKQEKPKAGRPPLYDETMVQTAFRLPASLLADLAALQKADGRASLVDVVREALGDYVAANRSKLSRTRRARKPRQR